MTTLTISMIATSKGWIGVDLDGTLAVYGGSIETIGEPVPAMLGRVRAWVDQGREVRIFTARAKDAAQCEMIAHWLVRHGLPRLQITDRKDFAMEELWDDRCRQVQTNTGARVGGPVFDPTRDLFEQVMEVTEAGGDLDAFNATIPKPREAAPRTVPTALACATSRFPA